MRRRDVTRRSPDARKLWDAWATPLPKVPQSRDTVGGGRSFTLLLFVNAGHITAVLRGLVNVPPPPPPSPRNRGRIMSVVMVSSCCLFTFSLVVSLHDETA